jgi:hypothetical protein
VRVQGLVRDLRFVGLRVVGGPPITMIGVSWPADIAAYNNRTMQVDAYMSLPREEREQHLEDLAPRELLQLGIDLFNAGHFWHSHEAWEAAWIPSERPVRAFYQGLIQVAAAFVHLTRHEYPGTEKLLDEALAKLERYQPDYLTIDSQKLFAEAAAVRALVLGGGPDSLRRFDTSSLPRIVQQPLPNSGTISAGEQSIHWLEWPASTPGADTVVLIHAPGQLARLWQPLAARLAGSRRVVAPDLPGHGLSTASGDLETDIDALQAWLAASAPNAAAIVSVGAAAGIAARLAGVVGLLEVCLSPREPTGPIDGDVPEQRRRVWPGRWEMFAGLRTPRWFAHWRADLLWTYVEDGTEVLPDGSICLRCDDASEARLLGLGRPLDRLVEVNVSPLSRPVEAAARLVALLDEPGET